MPSIGPTAKQTNFQKFYHYQRVDGDHRNFLIAMLREQKLFCSDPHNVNDPWDFKPWFDYRPMLKDPSKREELIAFYRTTLPPAALNDPRRPIIETRLRNDDSWLRWCMEDSSRVLAEELRKRRIYCLTPFPTSTLMWSHYACNHRGICLEFEKNNPLIEEALPVRYRETYPEWTPQTARENTLDMVLTKSKDWCYQQEFRIIATSLPGPTQLHGNFVVLPPGALTAIIVGCENPDNDDILSIVADHAPWPISVKRAVRVPNHYGLTIEETPSRNH